MSNLQEPIIVIDQLKKSYGKVQAVKGISMSVEKGEIFGFLGPNGAGKTTTIRCLLDVIRPTSGTIRVMGLEEELSRLPSVSMVKRTNKHYQLTVSGNMDLLIKALAQHEVIRLYSEEAPLEEVFLQFYEEPEKAEQTIP